MERLYELDGEVGMNNLYSVWVEGREVTNSFIEFVDADYLASQYVRDGYENVKVVLVFTINQRRNK